MKKLQKTKTKKTKYTISTLRFDTMTAAKKKILDFATSDKFNEDTKIFEVTEEYDVEIKKVVLVKKV